MARSAVEAQKYNPEVLLYVPSACGGGGAMALNLLKTYF